MLLLKAVMTFILFILIMADLAKAWLDYGTIWYFDSITRVAVASLAVCFIWTL